nr:hypothetical protein [Lachnospiraceae bacterium]
IRWFRTGDRAVCDADGDYELLGRSDNMVKLRGFRIETGEVEVQIGNALGRLGLNESLQPVVVVKRVCGMEHLCCYYEAEKELDQSAVTKEISQYLAEYMIPEIWVRLDRLPRNANGKVVRRDLPQPSVKHMTKGSLESEVIARLVWTAIEVLGENVPVGPEDRFTDLGGTSLSAMKYATMLREQGIRISADNILRYNVLRRIAEEAEVAYEQLWPPEVYEQVLRDFAGRGEKVLKVLPLSPEQDEILFAQVIYPEWNFRKMYFLQLDSSISEEDLREAVDVAAEENEGLRASVVFHDTYVIQKVITDRRLPLEMLEAKSFGKMEIRELRNRLLTDPMDLQSSPLVRFVGVRAEGMTYVGAMAHRIAMGNHLLRKSFARILSILEKKYPGDSSIPEWRELCELDGTMESGEGMKLDAFSVKKEAPPDICVYSENSGPRLFFVHTANTGSGAYYRLAARIGDKVSFSVFEPYNLYHQETARYGIRNIAENYIRILKKAQPEGPYYLGGWCYGGMIAHEMACQLQAAGEEIKHLFMLDSHAITDKRVYELSKQMFEAIDENYFRSTPLFDELIETGMLNALINNAAHISEDMKEHVPSFYHGDVTYFKPEQIPAGISEENARYWKRMMEYAAGNYENYCEKDRLRVIRTPHEHDLMMDDPSLDIIVPEILRSLGLGDGS